MNGLLVLMAMAAPQPQGEPLIPAFFTGEKLFELCTSSEDSHCWMYVAGVLDGVFHTQGKDEPRTLCGGNLTNNRDAAAVVVAYLRENPNVRRQAAAVAVEKALAQRVGCSMNEDNSPAASAFQSTDAKR